MVLTIVDYGSHRCTDLRDMYERIVRATRVIFSAYLFKQLYRDAEVGKGSVAFDKDDLGRIHELSRETSREERFGLSFTQRLVLGGAVEGVDAGDGRQGLQLSQNVSAKRS